MWELMKNYQEYYIALAALCAVGLFSKLIVYVTYLRLLKESQRMGESKHKVLRNICDKYEKTCHFNMEVKNVDVFLEKQILKLKWLKLPLTALDNINVLAFVLAICVGLAGGLQGYVENADAKEIVLLFLFSVIGAATQVFLEAFAQTKTHREMLLVYVRDYIDNFLSYAIVAKKMKEKKASMKEELENADTMPKGVQELKSCLNDIACAKVEETVEEKQKKKPDATEEEVVEDILRKFFLEE